jgi:acetoin utilization deacetylase AcuC-like enzyme
MALDERSSQKMTTLPTIEKGGSIMAAPAPAPAPLPTVYYNASHVFHADSADMHPESPRRIEAILAALAPHVDAARLRLNTVWSEDVPTSHPRPLRSWTLADGDTYKTIYTDDVVRVTNRMLADAVEDLLGGKTRCGFVLCRPPGHHASIRGPAGFCHTNNVWTAANLLLEQGLRRIAIYDWDVHHGDGTQAFVETATGDKYEKIRFVTTHARGPGIYPGTGAYEKTERVLSIPFRRGATHTAFLKTFHEEVLPFLQAGADGEPPEIVLVSAGYDGHADDPMELMRLTKDTYRDMSDALRTLGCPVLFVLEGGYQPNALAKCVLETLRPWMSGTV